MKTKIKVLLGGSTLALAAAQAHSANYATCLLDKLPGTQNDVAAQANMQVCLGKHPGGIEAVPQGEGLGLFGFNSGAECTAKKAGDTRSNRAAILIGVACRKLYDKPTFTYEEAFSTGR